MMKTAFARRLTKVLVTTRLAECWCPKIQSFGLRMAMERGYITADIRACSQVHSKSSQVSYSCRPQKLRQK